MDANTKKELYDKSKNLSLKELLDVLTNEDRPEAKKALKEFIYANYSESPEFELKKALIEIRESKYPEFVKQRLSNAKICVRDIKDRLDIEHINSFAEIEIILSEAIKINKALIDD